MKERPIIFSAPMVQALLDGHKTQTRRIVKTQPTDEDWAYARKALGGNTENAYPAVSDRGGIGLRIDDQQTGSFLAAATGFFERNNHCPYGQPGEALWVKETFAHHVQAIGAKSDEDGPFVYAADGEAATQYRLSDKWKPSIFMPRWASRILLEITAVRVERLQDISEADAIAEGWMRRPYISDDPQVHIDAARDWYRDLWETINGPGSWDLNPFCWVIIFRRIK